MNLILFNNGLWNLYVVMNNGGVITTYSDISEIPNSMKATARTLQSVYLGPHQARCLGLADKLYPNFPKCGLPFYDDSEVHECVAESCVIAGNKGYGSCPFFDKSWVLMKEETVDPEPTPEPTVSDNEEVNE